ncbi:MAG TPA: HAD-IIIA family hydrolase [Chitinophagaceae bacterium]|jgi:3-deoxy-D-manno-octulosonate 8-phosphate phosphatase (KDO 8-P phosphatase)
MSDTSLKKKALQIKLLLTDVDGVLTDNGVYYSERGEEMKRFSIRDGMGVERLRKLAGIETGIITGETSGSVVKRAEKLQIVEVHLGVKDKAGRLKEILERKALSPAEVAFIGDDVNDLEIMKAVGLTACPVDAMQMVLAQVDYTCKNKGGDGAFREFAEWLIASRP